VGEKSIVLTGAPKRLATLCLNNSRSIKEHKRRKSVGPNWNKSLVECWGYSMWTLKGKGTSRKSKLKELPCSEPTIWRLTTKEVNSCGGHLNREKPKPSEVRLPIIIPKINSGPMSNEGEKSLKRGSTTIVLQKAQVNKTGGIKWKKMEGIGVIGWGASFRKGNDVSGSLFYRGGVCARMSGLILGGLGGVEGKIIMTPGAHGPLLVSRELVYPGMRGLGL